MSKQQVLRSSIMVSGSAQDTTESLTLGNLNEIVSCATLYLMASTVTAAAATVIRMLLRTWWCAHPQSMQGPSGAPLAVSAILKLGNSMAG